MEKRGRAAGPRISRRTEATVRRRAPWKIPLVASAIVASIIVIAAVVILQAQGTPRASSLATTASASGRARSIVASDGVGGSDIGTASAAATASVEVEVPDVVGKALSTAEMLLQVAGFKTLTRVADQPTGVAAPDTVLSQAPPAGTRLRTGDSVTIHYNPRAAGLPQGAQPVVVIDPGHQAHADTTLEPIGPGSSVRKAKVAYGATGVFTKVPEYQQALAISLRLRGRLEASGVRVIMVRTTDDVNIANSRRAVIGNEAGAALTIRVHLNGSSNHTVRGISTLFPHGNAWVAPIEAQSKRAAQLVHAAVLKATGARDAKVVGRADMTGFNWAKRPTIIVECGFMSNADDDKLANKPAYRDKLAAGMTAGIMEYLASAK